MQANTWRGILLLALLALLSWQLARKPVETITGQVRPPDMRLNYALYDFNARLLDETGQVKLDLASPVLRNDAESGIGSVETPEIRIQEAGDRWYITADSAIISADRERVTLSGRVNLSRLDEITHQTLEIATSDVLLNVTPRTAMTDAGVKIRQRDDRLEAIGMKLDMVNEHYELLHEVRAVYETR